ncbi:uracil-DNA glycosylase family protein [Silvanigrella sp.]|uniref:uracil-DNA glycosylase family protein n=1 Tax=Silvanigrella sp. TaxID=2024976 RepID=UPI0037C7B791
MTSILKKILQCKFCVKELPLKPKPILNFSASAKILIAGQAQGIKAHESGIPWNDQSGERLRDWLGIDKDIFYNPKKIPIVPMGFCYPGKGKSGDLPPRKECKEIWFEKIHEELSNIQLKIIIGSYAQEYYFSLKNETLTDVVKSWKKYLPSCIPLPHPSPRNNIWLKKNPWFEKDLLPVLRKKVALYL